MAPNTLYHIFEPLFHHAAEFQAGRAWDCPFPTASSKTTGEYWGYTPKPNVGTCFTLYLPQDQNVQLELETDHFVVWTTKRAFARIIKSYFAKAKQAPAEVLTNPEKVLTYLEEYPENRFWSFPMSECPISMAGNFLRGSRPDFPS